MWVLTFSPVSVILAVGGDDVMGGVFKSREIGGSRRSKRAFLNNWILRCSLL